MKHKTFFFVWGEGFRHNLCLLAILVFLRIPWNVVVVVCSLFSLLFFFFWGGWRKIVIKATDTQFSDKWNYCVPNSPFFFPFYIKKRKRIRLKGTEKFFYKIVFGRRGFATLFMLYWLRRRRRLTRDDDARHTSFIRKLKEEEKSGATLLAELVVRRRRLVFSFR